MSNAVFKSARLISVLTLLSRVLGLGRDMACSYAFGAGAIWSAFTIAFQIPNLLRRLFGEGALSAASIPVLTERLAASGREGVDDLAGRVVGLLLAVLAAVCLVAEGVTWGLAWYYRADTQAALVLHLTILTLPFSILICATAVLGGIQNVLGKFAPSAAAPVVLNVFMIAGALAGHRIEPGAGIVILAIATLLAGGVQVVWLWGGLRRAGLRLRLQVSWHDPAIRRIVLTMLPMVAGLSAVQFNALADTLIAYWCVEGDAGPAILSYAQRLYQFPLGVFAIALATAIFPTLSRFAAQKDFAGMGQSLSRGICVASFEALPCAVGMIVVREPLVRLLFDRGRFAESPDAAGRVALALLMYALGIWAFGVNQLLVRAYYALGDTRTPLRISVVNVFINLAMNLVLVQTVLREAGLALATSICATLQVVVLAAGLQRQLHTIVWKSVAINLCRIVVAALCMALVVWLADHSLLAAYPVVGGRTWLRLLVLIVVGGASYLAATGTLRCPELREMIRG